MLWMPSFWSLPWTRSEPQAFTLAIWITSLQISSDVRGRPVLHTGVGFLFWWRLCRRPSVRRYEATFSHQMDSTAQVAVEGMSSVATIVRDTWFAYGEILC